MSALKSVSAVTVYCLSDPNQMYQFKNRPFFPPNFFLRPEKLNLQSENHIKLFLGHRKNHARFFQAHISLALNTLKGKLN